LVPPLGGGEEEFREFRRFVRPPSFLLPVPLATVMAADVADLPTMSKTGR
jgi:hypothetical protein